MIWVGGMSETLFVNLAESYMYQSPVASYRRWRHVGGGMGGGASAEHVPPRRAGREEGGVCVCAEASVLLRRPAVPRFVSLSL